MPGHYLKTVRDGCRCHYTSRRDPAEPQLGSWLEAEQAEDCPVHPLTVDCPCCSGSGEHVWEHWTRDPQRQTPIACAPCEGTGQMDPGMAREWRVWAAEHGPGPTPHPTATVPADPFLGPPRPEPF